MLKLVKIPRIHDPRGSLSVIEGDLLPFAVKRVYYLYDIPGGESQRAGHAHYRCHRLLFAINGSFIVYATMRDGTFYAQALNRPWLGVEIPPLTWLELRDFSGGAICLVLASTAYESEDYIRERDKWEQYCIASQLMEKP